MSVLNPSHQCGMANAVELEDVPAIPGVAGAATPWACAGMGSVFTVRNPRNVQRAVAVCGSCLSRAQCLASGQAAGSDGVWGGVLLRRGKVVGGASAVSDGRRATTASIAVAVVAATA